MSLSTTAIEALGFSRILPGQEVEAAFHSFQVFEVQGFTIEKDTIVSKSGTAAGVPFDLGVGNSLNRICRTLLSDDYTADETSWLEEKKATPPFLVVHCGPTVVSSSGAGWMKLEDDSVLTYDSFATARHALRTMESAVTPAVRASLSCAFSGPDQVIRFRPVDRAAFGLTADGTVVHDIVITMSGSGYVSRRLEETDVLASLSRASRLASSFDAKVAHLFHLGLDDSDPLKRFLYFFIALEIHTHRVFATINRSDTIRDLVSVPERIRASGLELFNRDTSHWSLAERFAWCVVGAWTHMSDADVSEFRRLKKVRDRISHGVIATPPGEAVSAVEQLARRAHQVPEPSAP